MLRNFIAPDALQATYSTRRKQAWVLKKSLSEKTAADLGIENVHPSSNPTGTQKGRGNWLEALNSTIAILTTYHRSHEQGITSSRVRSLYPAHLYDDPTCFGQTIAATANRFIRSRACQL